MLSERPCKELYKYQTDNCIKQEKSDGMHEIRGRIGVRVKLNHALILL